MKQIVFFVCCIFLLCSGMAYSSGQGFSLDNPFTIERDGDGLQIPRHDDTDPRYIALDLTAGEGITVRMTAHTTSGTMNFYVYSPLNLEYYICSATDIKNGYTSWNSFTATTSGKYYIKVTGASGRADVFVDNAFFNPGTRDEDRKFHGSLYTSTYLRDGTYDVNYGHRWFRFEARQGDEVSLSLTHSSPEYMNFYVYRPYKSNYFKSSTYIDNDEIGSVSFTAQYTGVYYVHVKSYYSRGEFHIKTTNVRPDLDEDYDNLFNTVEYRRGTRTDLADTNDNGISDYEELRMGRFGWYPTEWLIEDMENATSLLNAKELPDLDTPVMVHFSPSGKDRYIKFDLDKGNTVSVAMTVRRIRGRRNYYWSGGSMRFYVYNSEGKSIKYSDNLDDGETDVVSFTAQVTGTYYIKITGSPGVAEVGVHNAYFNPGMKDQNRFFFGTSVTASYLKNTEYTKSSRDRWFRFEVNENDLGKEVSLSLSVLFGSGEMNYYIYQPDKSNYFRSETYIRNGETRTDSFVPWTLGTYYVLVTGYPGRFSWNTTVPTEFNPEPEPEPEPEPDLQPVIILTQEKSSVTVKGNREVTVYGCQGKNDIVVERGVTARLLHMIGNNEIQIKAYSTDFMIRRSGSYVFLTDASFGSVELPATNFVQTIHFNDIAADLTIRNGKIFLKNQEITLKDKPLHLHTGVGPR